jgi:hypothetical protein
VCRPCVVRLRLFLGSPNRQEEETNPCEIKEFDIRLQQRTAETDPWHDPGIGLHRHQVSVPNLYEVEGEMLQSGIKTGEGRIVLVTIALLLTFLTLHASAEASPVLEGSVFEQGLSGSTVEVDGTVNYAVLTMADFSALSGLGTFYAGSSSSGLDSGATYVYLFQVTNGGSDSNTIFSFSTGFAPTVSSSITSWGYFQGTVFTENGVEVSASNPLDPGTTLGFDSASTSDPTASLLFRTSNSILAYSFDNGAGIAAGGTSSIIVYTSNLAPDMFSSQITYGAYAGSGATPGAADTVPEPSTILLMTLGLAGLAGFRRGFHRKGGRTMSGSKLVKRLFLVILLLAFGLLGVVARADADAIYSGSTFLPTVAGVDGTVDWAAYTASDFSAALTAAGIDSSSFTAGAGSGLLGGALSDLSAYVYVYQVANNGSNDLAITYLNINLNGVTPTSWGFLPDVVMTDSAGNVSATNSLGWGSLLGFASDTSVVDPTAVTMTAGVTTSNLFVTPQIAAGQISSLLIFTADAAPVLGSAVIVDEGTTSSGNVVGPGGNSQEVPEPATLLLLGSGLVGLAGLRWRRYHRQ